MSARFPYSTAETASPAECARPDSAITGRGAPWIVGTTGAAVMVQLFGAPSSRMIRLTSSLLANWEYRSVRPERFTYCGGVEVPEPGTSVRPQGNPGESSRSEAWLCHNWGLR